jgi:hypothetical protein
MSASCIGQPISWLRLETFATGSHDAEIATHIAACPVCAQCLAELRADVVALPPLVVPARATPWWRRRWLLAPAMAFAAAIVVLVLVRGGPERDDIAYAVKGIGDVRLGVVRERAGTIRTDVHTFTAGDRWKVMVTCPPSAEAWVDVAVVDAGTVDYPLAPARVSCGNDVVIPGAFSITGSRANLVCVRIDASTTPLRSPPHPGDSNVACVTLRPE